MFWLIIIGVILFCVFVSVDMEKQLKNYSEKHPEEKKD